MQILGLSGMYFDAVVVEGEKSLHFFRLALAILWMKRSRSKHCNLTKNLGMCLKMQIFISHFVFGGQPAEFFFPPKNRQMRCWLFIYTHLH